MEPSRLDPLIAVADRALRAVFAPARASRPVPGVAPATPALEGSPEAFAAGAAAGGATGSLGPLPGELTGVERREAAALMRVNHAGELAAQALYHGQALACRSEITRDLLLKAAREESDHLAWCETRLRELGSRPSLLNPVWYCGSFMIGALAGAVGDRSSLSFVVETERQVEGHLDQHLSRLPSGDSRSRAILQTMRTDEITHGAAARAAGGSELPRPVSMLMRQIARIMTTAAYWI